ncbi:ABC transporter ATP-binding protein [Solitalea canadensis]|uniref:ABC-type multidrug transport system, ATPase component n=1 Tax=Solitalea canadensis (strain ATCC 29591 / DSM 3403 / JCM 21819 / LMG 8368 / NBRC 15130 / NCIMB 12057 / USAM 9D) TaxID=929556 RepID=H8KTZ4_SOLCM|nr:ABC transporter ATP-binding protein [Solitalea canadensis]AFD06844.1 ABC-type multidrug transport system, ATPase component [Solitalea canadensis DSM 3403]
MIQINELKKSFGKLHVLKGITTSFEPGQVISVLGPNSSGKTTLIKSILGMVIPDSGTITFNGTNIQSNPSYKNHIGYMPQIGRYPDNMKIGQLIDMMKDIRNFKKIDEELLEQFDLPSIYQKPMRTLSGGTRQKVSAVLAFMFNPEVLILDEPTAGLDPVAAEILKAKIHKEKENGKLILLTSHIMSEVDELADKVLYMMEGSIRFNYDVDDFKAITGEQKLGKAIINYLKMNVYA